MKKEKKKIEKEIEKLRILGLDKITLKLFHKTTTGRILEFIIIFTGIGGAFLYAKILDVGVIISIILGFLTWFIVGLVIDKVVIKIYRIDKQLDWLLETPEGIRELKSKGITDKQIEKLKEEVENNPFYTKKFD